MQLLKQEPSSPTGRSFHLDASEFPKAGVGNELQNSTWVGLYKNRPLKYNLIQQNYDNLLRPVKTRLMEDSVFLPDLGDLVSARLRLLAAVEKNRHELFREHGRNETPFLSTLSSVEKGLLQDWTRDHVSFYLCLLGFCHIDHLRQWFSRCEENLFRMRLRELTSVEQESVFQANGVPARVIPTLAKVSHISDLGNTDADSGHALAYKVTGMSQRYATLGVRKIAEAATATARALTGKASISSELPSTVVVSSGESASWYRVPFRHVLDAVRRRSVCLHRGEAVVQNREIVTMQCNMFQDSLGKLLSQAVPQRLSLQHSASNYVIHKIDAIVTVEAFAPGSRSDTEDHKLGVVHSEQIDSLAAEHFPPCMKQLQDQLNRDRHLKFHGRFQYSTFLKRIGLSMDEAIEFFGSREAMGLEAFKRSSYAYAIRHHYGKEGKHVSYNAMGCGSIIMGAPPSSSSCHGCPFRHSESSNLHRMLREQLPKGSPQEIEDIVKDAQSQHYTRSCHRFFIAKHPSYQGDGLFTSPYQFYAASRELAERRTEVKLEKNDSSFHVSEDVSPGRATTISCAPSVSSPVNMPPDT